MNHKGKQIRTLRDLNTAKQNRRSVFSPSLACFAKPSPAAWIMQQSGELILRLIADGLYLYRPSQKKSRYGRESK